MEWGRVIVCGLTGCLLAWYGRQYHTIKPYYITNTFPAMFFYGMGYYMKEKQFHHNKKYENFHKYDNP